MPDIQVFGTDDSQATRAAIRFFRERRIVVHYSDLRKRPIAAGELRRFVQKLGPTGVMDTEGRAWRDAGLSYLALDEAGAIARIVADPGLLRLPLVRFEQEVTAGRAEETWRRWLGRG